MSETFEIVSSIKNYEVILSSEFTLSTIAQNIDFILIDKNVNNLWPLLGVEAPMVLDPLEKKKSLSSVSAFIESLRDKGATRQSMLLSIGGGITQDISTFTASCYMRGIEWIYFPTTLLGMVDSCIGGKSSINVGKYKNIAGNFFPPKKIIVDVNFCKTLSEQQLVEGLCEAVKISYAHSFTCFNEYRKAADEKTSLYDYDYEKIVSLSLNTKKGFIEEDEFDNGIRLLLNFGHTFGHALEGASDFKISHGVAVGLGMFCAFNLSVTFSLVKKESVSVNELLNHVGFLLSKVSGLHAIICSIDMSVALKNFKSDKKHETNSYWAILFDNDGQLIRHKFEKSDSNDHLILSAFESLKDK